MVLVLNATAIRNQDLKYAAAAAVCPPVSQTWITPTWPCDCFKSVTKQRSKTATKITYKRNNMIVTDLFESAPEQGVAEGLVNGEYGRVLDALQLYYPRLSMEELNVPGYHKVVADKANVPVEYAAQVINDFVRDNDPDEFSDFNDDEQGVTEGHGNYAGDTPVNLGGVSMKMIQTGDTVKYIDQKAEVVDMSPDRKYSRITIPTGMGSITKDVLTSDLRQLGQGMAEGWRDMFRSKPVAPTPAAAPVGGAQRQAYAGRNPATNKPWTGDELRAKHFPEVPGAEAPATTATATKRTGGKIPGQVSMTPNAIRKREARASGATATTAATAPNPFGQMANQLQNYGTSTGGRVTGTATGLKHTANPNNPNAISATAAAPAAIPAAATTSTATAAATPVAKPNFAQQNAGYKSVNYAPNVKTGASMPKPLGAPIAAAPAVTKVTSGGPTPDEKAKLAQRIAQAVKEPVAEMLQMVETKEDVQRIKQFVDQTFVKYGAVNETTFALRNQILEHVTQVGAQRRRDFAAQQAH